MFPNGVLTRWVGWLVWAAVWLAGTRSTPAEHPELESVLRGRGAAAVVLDVSSGRLLDSAGNLEAQAPPGSTVKPFILRAALAHGVIGEHSTVHCTRTLRIAGHNLACVHPRDVAVLDARQALSESCNTYFAAVAQRLSSEQVAAALRGGGLRVVDAPAATEQRELMALGLLDVTASVRQMAGAYRGLALWMADARQPRESAAARVVRDGLVVSVETGAAHAAHVDGLTVAGKTGTVDVPGTGLSHGWFAGIVYGADARPAWVLAVFVPNGNGRDAAALARRLIVARR